MGSTSFKATKKGAVPVTDARVDAPPTTDAEMKALCAKMEHWATQRQARAEHMTLQRLIYNAEADGAFAQAGLDDAALQTLQLQWLGAETDGMTNPERAVDYPFSMLATNRPDFVVVIWSDTTVRGYTLQECQDHYRRHKAWDGTPQHWAQLWRTAQDHTIRVTEPFIALARTNFSALLRGQNAL